MDKKERDEFYQKLGRKIKKFRKEKKWNQTQLAEKAHVSQGYMSEIEKGSVRMTLDTFCEICEAFKITPEDMLGIKETSIGPKMIMALAKMTPKERENLFETYETIKNISTK